MECENDHLPQLWGRHRDATPRPVGPLQENGVSLLNLRPQARGPSLSENGGCMAHSPPLGPWALSKRTGVPTPGMAIAHEVTSYNLS